MTADRAGRSLTRLSATRTAAGTGVFLCRGYEDIFSDESVGRRICNHSFLWIEYYRHLNHFGFHYHALFSLVCVKYFAMQAESHAVPFDFCCHTASSYSRGQGRQGSIFPERISVPGGGGSGGSTLDFSGVINGTRRSAPPSLHLNQRIGSQRQGCHSCTIVAVSSHRVSSSSLIGNHRNQVTARISPRLGRGGCL